jgi:hypothetical protein
LLSQVEPPSLLYLASTWYEARAAPLRVGAFQSNVTFLTCFESGTEIAGAAGIGGIVMVDVGENSESPLFEPILY